MFRQQVSSPVVISFDKKGLDTDVVLMRDDADKIDQMT
jgi:hypothetical protein